MNKALRAIALALALAVPVTFLGGCDKQEQKVSKKQSTAKKAKAKVPAKEKVWKAGEACNIAPPGTFAGKSSPTGKAAKPRVERGYEPSEQPCAPNAAWFKNGCVAVKTSTYCQDGKIVIVDGMPRNKKGKVSHFSETVQFPWKTCKNKDFHLRPPRPGIDADFHFECPK